MFDLAKHHATGVRLQNAGHHDVNFLTDVIATHLSNDHRAIFQEADTLTDVVTFFNQLDVDRITPLNGRAERVIDFVDVDGLNRFKLGNFRQVGIIRDQHATQTFSQCDQLLICRTINLLGVFVNLNFDARITLQAVQHIETPAAAVSAILVVAVGNRLHLLQNNARDNHLLRDQPGLGKVGDPAVNNHAGIKHKRTVPFDLTLKFDVGNDEAEIVLRLDQRADADVGEECRRQDGDWSIFLMYISGDAEIILIEGSMAKLVRNASKQPTSKPM